ncbi:LysR substrate-binding domain-containing protein [Paracoccus aerius]
MIDAQSIPSLVSAGFGIGLVPAGIAATAGPLIHRPIAPVPPVSDIFAVYRRGEHTPALSALLATLEHVFSEDC